MDLGLDVLSVEGTAIVTCTGRSVHGETARRFQACAARLIARHRRVVLDLRGVTYADARGLGTLASLVRRARARRCLVLAMANERLERLLRVTGLDAFLRGVIPTDTVDSASDRLAAVTTGLKLTPASS